MEKALVISSITLTTDFGLTDEYAGIVKGVILRYAPRVAIVDLCHAITSQNITQAAYLLEASYTFFPSNSLHVVIVDPGVGSDRRILWAEIGGHYFLAPDNGILTLVMRDGTVEEIRAITNHDLFLSPVSSTFHGRDIFAPVAGRLAAGLSPESLGPLINQDSVNRLSLQAPALDHVALSITGRVIGQDHFGNLHTDIHLRLLHELSDNPENLRVFIGSHCLGEIRRHYLQAEQGDLIPLLGSRNYLEIAASQASAARKLPNALSLPVIVKK